VVAASQIYERRLVAFVDILGWSEACKTESRELVEVTNHIHRLAADYNQAEKDRINSINIPGVRPLPWYQMVHVGAFSDNIAISLPEFMGYSILGVVREVCVKLLPLGFLARGGITIGDIHHKDNVIFGPALVEAVQLEKEAVYPRVVCSPALLDFLATKPSEDWIEELITDQLGRTILNLFSFGAKIEWKKEDLNFADELWGIYNIQNIIDNEVQRFTELRYDKIAEKWRYMRDVMSIMLRRFSDSS
jgi:hypothetical protein